MATDGNACPMSPWWVCCWLSPKNQGYNPSLQRGEVLNACILVAFPHISLQSLHEMNSECHGIPSDSSQQKAAAVWKGRGAVVRQIKALTFIRAGTFLAQL